MSTERLEAIGEVVRSRLDAVHEAREAAFTDSRAAIRAASKAIRAVHRGEDPATLLDEADALLRSAQDRCAPFPQLTGSGPVADADKERCEARLFLALARGEGLPEPEALGADDAAWLGGLAEAVGELRRAALDHLRAGEVAAAETLVGRMDDVYALLVTIDYPEGITGGLRRSTDVTRGILERTRGDVTTARLQARLGDALQAHRRDVLEAERDPG